MAVVSGGMLDLELSDDILTDLANITKYADKLQQVIQSGQELGPWPNIAVAIETIATQAGLPTSQVYEIVLPVLNVYNTGVRYKRSPIETVQILTSNLERKARTAEEKTTLEAWKQAESLIAEGISKLGPDHPLVLTQKATRVIYAHQNLFTDGRIYTDIRPVFNGAGDTVTQMVITHVLSVVYFDGTQERQIQLALDASDIADLRQLCDRAEKKATVLKKQLQSMPWRTTIVREVEEPKAPENQKEVGHDAT